jgi:hypothetical protein
LQIIKTPMNNLAKQTSISKAGTILGICVLGWLLNGCSTAPIIKATRATPGPDAAAGKSVKVFAQNEKPAGSYEVLGAVSALPAIRGIMYIAGDNKVVVKYMKNEASAMGADMLIGFNKGNEKMTAKSWSTAIAAKMRDSGDASPSRRGDFCVAIPHSLIPLDVSKGSKARKDDAFIQKLAQYHLAQKGYYSISIDGQLPDPFEAGLSALPAGDLAKYGGDDCDLILGVQLVRSKGVAAGVFTIQNTELETALYSKSQNKVIWKNTAAGEYLAHFLDFNPGGLLVGMAEWLVPSSKRANALDAALDKAFQTLPDVSTKTTK